ncbi:MAG: filamentous hemagglutinin, partial [Sphingomonas bacterium]|uniref:two-partner secretion domain-containing protein n=1 Tax=Sphingomonas bacterium TaxID=1895847 RepID=UPI002636AE7C
MYNVNSCRRALFGSSALARLAAFATIGLATPIALASSAEAQNHGMQPVTEAQASASVLPGGGSVAAGSATIATSSGSVIVQQTSQNAVLNWQSFSIGANDSVAFVQPNSSAVALNRVLGPEASSILGTLSANGKVFLINPNGVVFGKGANVDVGGLVASTLGMSDSDFMAGHYSFSGSGGSVRNDGTITADGGYVALLGAHVDNRGTIRANLGTVALATGEAITLDVVGDGLLNITVDKGAIRALIENGGLLRADGGQVILTAQAAGDLLGTVVNNSGIIEARTLENRGGRIVLLGDMKSGTVNLGGTLDASAANGGDGGFVETSAATVNVATDAHVTTVAARGATGTWLIDPADFIVGAGGNISGATLSAQLVTNNITISTMPLPGDTSTGNGDIIVNDAIAWSASGTPTTLTMNAYRDVVLNAPISATKGNIVACCGRDVIVNAALTTVNGSISLSAGQNVRVFHAITTTDGNIRLCAGHDVHIDAAITLTRGTTIPAQSLGLPIGLTLMAGADGSGPGVNGGTIIFAPLAPPTTVTVAPVTIYYNPVSYDAPTDFSSNFVLTEGAALGQKMLLFPKGDKV